MKLPLRRSELKTWHPHTHTHTHKYKIKIENISVTTYHRINRLHRISPGKLLNKQAHGTSRQKYWSGLPFPSPGDLTNLGIQPTSPEMAGRFFTTEPGGKLKDCSVIKSCPTLCDPMDCSLLGYSVHGVFQGRILEWVAISFTKESSGAGIKLMTPVLAGRFFITETPGKPKLNDTSM